MGLEEVGEATRHKLSCTGESSLTSFLQESDNHWLHTAQTCDLTTYHESCRLYRLASNRDPVPMYCDPVSVSVLEKMRVRCVMAAERQSSTEVGAEDLGKRMEGSRKFITIL